MFLNVKHHFLAMSRMVLQKNEFGGKMKIEYLQKERVCVLCDKGLLDDRLISQWNEGRIDIRKYDVEIAWKRLKKSYHRSTGSYASGKWWNVEIKDDVNII